MDQNAVICPKLIPAAVEYADPEEIDCFFCWKHHENLPKDVIKLNNRKYCQLYPKYARRELKAIVPNFDHCKTLYTKCDYRLEQYVHEIILRMEEQLKSHSKLLEDEMKMQKELIDDMWVNSQKYLILNGGGVCVKLYPEIISEPTEKRALCCFQRNLTKVHESNHRLSQSLNDIRTTMAELQRRCGLLDNTVESPFQVGAYYLRPVHNIRVIIVDLFQYFYQHLCKVKCWAELLDPGDSVAIEDYMVLIKPNKDFENNLLEYTNNCRCMRSKRTECIKGCTPC